MSTNAPTCYSKDNHKCAEPLDAELVQGDRSNSLRHDQALDVPMSRDGLLGASSTGLTGQKHLLRAEPWSYQFARESAGLRLSFRFYGWEENGTVREDCVQRI